MFQITYLEIDKVLNSFCALKMLNRYLKNSKLNVATDNIVNKLSNHVIKNSKKKNDFEAANFFSLVLDSVAVRNVLKSIEGDVGHPSVTFIDFWYFKLDTHRASE